MNKQHEQLCRFLSFDSSSYILCSKFFAHQATLISLLRICVNSINDDLSNFSRLLNGAFHVLHQHSAFDRGATILLDQQHFPFFVPTDYDLTSTDLLLH